MNKKFFNPNAGTISNIQDLLNFLRTEKGGNKPSGYLGRIYLRGQSNESWGLRPSVGRENYYSHGGKTIKKFSRLQEKNFIHRFRRHAYSYYQRTISEWEAFFLGRHHELPVRLLDWTASPLVALYWTCVSRNEFNNDGAIWVLICGAKEKDIIDIFKNKDPFRIKGVKLIPPFNINQRMIAQASILTIQDNPWKDLEKYSPAKFPKKDFDIEKIQKLIVPRQNKKTIIEDLEKVGINSRTLFPDFDGLAKGLWQTEVVRAGK